MSTRDKRIDAYIAKSADFAQPILREFREIVHEGCPDVEETVKWSMPFFVYKDDNLCHMAAFKQHCAFGFWKGSLILDDKKKSDEAMGQFGRVTSLKDLPPRRVLLGYVKKAATLNEEGVKVARKRPTPDEKKALTIPDFFSAALKKNKKASTAFNAFSYSHKKEYVEWVTEAKTDETRNKRLQASLEWLSEGKSRHWKYKNC